MIALRPMTSGDLPFVDSLRALVGWNQTLSYLEALFGLESNGCFIAEWNGAPAGTATTTRYGEALGWVGMLLVHPDCRRRGLGRALLEKCLDYLQDVHCVKLDATPMGKQVYDLYGFKVEWTLARWEAKPLKASPAPPASTGPMAYGEFSDAADLSPGDLAALESLDRSAFGGMRGSLLKSLISGSRRCVIGRDPSGELAGYGLFRAGSNAAYLGPVAAKSTEAGRVIILRLLEGAAGSPVYWDIPDPNLPARQLAEELGFSQQRPLIRMHLRPNRAAGNAAEYFAIADPSVG